MLMNGYIDTLSFAARTGLKIMQYAEEARKRESDGGEEVTEFERASIIAQSANDMLAIFGSDLMLIVQKRGQDDQSV